MTDSKTCDIDSSKFIAGGTYGFVYLYDNNTVIKINRTEEGNELVSSVSYPEMDVLFRLRSPYLLQGLSVFDYNECRKEDNSVPSGIGYKLELCTGTIEEFLGIDSVKLYFQPTYSSIKRLMLHYALGIRCLHRNNILHLDLSTLNFMYKLTSNGVIGKIIDFGFSGHVDGDSIEELKPLRSKRLRTTVYTRAPESLLDNKLYSEKGDIWSLGLIFLFMVTRVHPMDILKLRDLRGIGDTSPTDADYSKFTKSRIQLLFSPDRIHQTIINMLLIPGTNTYRIPLSEVEQYVNLVSNMLKISPVERYSIQKVIDHKFFTFDPENKYDALGLPINFKEEIQLENGNNCDIIMVDSISLTNRWTKNHSSGLDKLVFYINKYWVDWIVSDRFLGYPHTSFGTTGFLFLALDLYMRIILACDNNLTINQADSIAVASLKIANEMYTSHSDLNPQFLRDCALQFKYAILIEGKIMKVLKGIVLRDWIYSKCKTLDECAIAISEIFFTNNYDNFNNYLRIDVDEYFNLMRQQYKTLLDPYKVSKYSSINDFCKKLDIIDQRKQYLLSLNVIEIPSIVENIQLRDIRSEGFDILIKVLKTYYANESIIFFILSIDVYCLFVNSLSDMEIKTYTVDAIAIASTIIASVTIYQNNDKVPIEFKRISLQDKIISAYNLIVNSPTYKQSIIYSSPNVKISRIIPYLKNYIELFILYKIYYVEAIDSKGRQLCFVNYDRWNFTEILSAIRKIYIIPSQDEIINIGKFLQLSLPPENMNYKPIKNLSDLYYS